MELLTEKISGIAISKPQDGLIAVVIAGEHYKVEKMGVTEMEELYEVNIARRSK